MGLVILYTLLIFISLNYQAVINLSQADGMWGFVFTYGGKVTVFLVSVFVSVSLFIPVYQDFLGIKNRKDKAADKKIADAHAKGHGGKDFMKSVDITPWKPKPKKTFRPDSWVLSRIVLEGLGFGAIAYVGLRFWALAVTSRLVDWQVVFPQNNFLNHLNIAWWHYLALAIGSGVFMELIFRHWLFNEILKRISGFFKTKGNVTKGAVGAINNLVSYIPNNTIKWGKKVVTMTHKVVTSLVVAGVYTLLYFLFHNDITVYSLVYIFIWNLFLGVVCAYRSLGVSIYTHVWYNIFYFVLV